MTPVDVFGENNFILLCDLLAQRDKDLLNIIHRYGYPPLWSRPPTFATLIHIILEQQVSLASAKAAFLKLQEKIGTILPEKVLLLSDEELKACYFSRQKINYARELALSVVDGRLFIDQLKELPDEAVKTELKKIKGIGDWTVNIFLMMVLNRCDCFTTGDIALVKSIKEVKDLPAGFSSEEILLVADQWRPYRTIAAYLLWHTYIKKRNLKI